MDCWVFRPGGFSAHCVRSGWEWGRAGWTECRNRGVALRHGHLAQHHHCRFCIHLRRSLDPPESCGEIPRRAWDAIFCLVRVFQVGVYRQRLWSCDLMVLYKSLIIVIIITSNVTSVTEVQSAMLVCLPVRGALWWALLQLSIMLRLFFIVECGIAHFLCAMRVFQVRASSSSSNFCAKFCFFRDLHCWASPWRKIIWYPGKLKHLCWEY